MNHPRLAGGAASGVRPGSLADEQLARALRTVTAGQRWRAAAWAWFRGAT